MTKNACLNNLDSVELWPKGVLFHGKFNKVYKRKFAIYNPSPMEVAFKVADSLPDNMIVEPDHGYIRPKHVVKVMMSVFPFAENNLPETQEITVFLCSAPSSKNVNVWNGGDSWPEMSRDVQLVVKFVEFDEECESSSWSTSSNNLASPSTDLKPGDECDPTSGQSDAEETKNQ